MKKTIKKSGRKIAKRFSRLSHKAKVQGEAHLQANLISRFSHIRHVRLLILEWSLLVFVIILLATAQAFWYVRSYATQAFTSGGTYTEATLGQVNSLNPLFATTSSERTLSRLMFATLTAADYSGHIGLDLAASVLPDSTGKTWTIRLRDGLTWSDGQPLTNTDILYTVKVIQDPSLHTSYSGDLTGVTVSESSDGALVFSLPSPYVDFPTTLNVPILPAHILSSIPNESLLEHSFSSNPTVTSGAFSYKAVQNVGTAGEKIVYLSANPNYRPGAALLSDFTVHAFLDSDDIIAALNSGSVTATAELSALDAPAVTASDVYQKQTALNSGAYLFFNVDSPIVGQLSTRQAIRQGLDLAAIRSVADDQPPLNYPILSSQIELKTYPALPASDPAAARTELAAHNPTSADNPLRLVTVDTGYLPRTAEAVKSQLESLGLSVNLEIYQPGQDFYLSVLRPRSYDILLYEIELGANPDLFVYYHSSEASATGVNFSNYRNALADDAILATRTTMNSALRTAKYQTFLETWVHDVPAIGLYQVNLSYYVNRTTRTFSNDTRLIYPTDRFVDVNYWATRTTTKNRTP